MSSALRWTLLAPVISVAFVAAGVVGSILGHALGIWEEPMMGVLAAVAVVFVAYCWAPSRRLAVATCALLAGGCLAWILVKPPSHYPESYGERAYAPTYLPIAATYVSGLAAWLGCLWHHRRDGVSRSP